MIGESEIFLLFFFTEEIINIIIRIFLESLNFVKNKNDILHLHS